MHTTTYDVVIVGGGAAGLSAALVLGRARRHVLVVDARAPRNAPAAHMHGFIFGTPLDMPSGGEVFDATDMLVELLREFASSGAGVLS